MLTNREWFFKIKKENKDGHKFLLNDSEIYGLLIDANKFKNYTELIANFDSFLFDEKGLKRKLKRIQNGEAYQYVLGYTFFNDLKIMVNKKVLIPRPETEELVKNLIELINKNNFNKESIADICCGSCCIALSLKKEFPNSKIYASDLYKEPLKLSKKNSQNLDLDIEIIKSNKLHTFIENYTKVDILVSNPPYVSNKKDIEEYVNNNEPISAIFTKNGTTFYESYFKNYEKVMNEKFLMAFEINFDQEEKLTQLIGKYFDLNKIKYFFKKDIYNKVRYLFIIGGYENACF